MEDKEGVYSLILPTYIYQKNLLLKQNDNTMKKILTNSRKLLRQTTTIENKSLPRIAHHFHQPITKDSDIQEHKRERELAKDGENFSPILLTMGELYF